MTTDPPPWLTNEFIQTSLSRSIHHEVCCLNFSVNQMTGQGNNYTSNIYRVDIKYNLNNQENNISFIIKSPITENSVFALQEHVTLKEVAFYKKYLPKINILHDEDITAKSYFSPNENILILEDLKSQGYEMADRVKQLDYNHSGLALTTLARFHAISVKLHEDQPEFVEEIGREIFYTTDVRSDDMERFSKMSFQILADEVKLSKDSEKYSKRLQEYSETVWDAMVESFKPKQEQFNVLNHGDFWIANMLFKYDSTGKPISLKLIDMQENRYTSPSIDLIYFLNGSVRDDVRTEKSNELIDIYVKELNDNLELLGSKRRLTRLELDNHIKERAFYRLVVNVSFLPWFLANPDECEILSLEEFHFDGDSDKNRLRTYYKTESFKQLIIKRLGEFEKSDWF